MCCQQTNITAVIIYFSNSFWSLTFNVSQCHSYRECTLYLYQLLLKLMSIANCFELCRYIMAILYITSVVFFLKICALMRFIGLQLYNSNTLELYFRNKIIFNVELLFVLLFCVSVNSTFEIKCTSYKISKYYTITSYQNPKNKNAHTT